jgi:hypothetical protein
VRYWIHKETGKLIKVGVQMVIENWTELTEEQYKEAIMTDAELLKLVDEETKNIKRGKE